MYVHIFSKGAIGLYLILFIVIIFHLIFRKAIPEIIVFFMWFALIMNFVGIIINQKTKNDSIE